MYKSSSNLVKMIIISLLATIAFVLMNFSFPIMPIPGLQFLKVDVSDIPVLIASVIFSPIIGVLVLFLKCVLYLIAKPSIHELIGAPANFIAGLMLVLPISVIYHRLKTKMSIVYGFIVGTILMASIMTVLNYYAIIPLYAWALGFQLDESLTVFTIIGGLFAFNVMKGIIIGIAFVPLFVTLRVWIEQKQKQLA